MFKRIKTKTFWEKGGGEVLGFLWISPVIIVILALLISIVQLGSMKERLEYTAYLACRQAVVVSDTDEDKDYLDDAEEIALKVAEEDLEKSGLKYEEGSVKVELSIVNNSEGENSGSKDSSKTTTSKKSKTSTKKSTKKSSKSTNKDSEEEMKWEKGNYVQCTVSVDVEAVTPFMSGTKSASIVMMIEKPADGDGDYIWFEAFE